MSSQNFKYCDIRLEPCFSLKHSANFWYHKVWHLVTRNNGKNARNFTKHELWNDGYFHSTKHAVRLLKWQIDGACNYVYVSIKFNSWYLKRIYVEKDTQTIVQHQILRVQTVSYLNGGYQCSCKLFEKLGICCRNIICLGIKVAKQCLHVKNWNDYNFYFKRDSTTVDIDFYYDELRKMKKITCMNLTEQKNTHI